jgi:threonine/homoserine/homoserine lactone efflux protein
MHSAYVASDLVPAVTFWLVAVLAAVPAFSVVRQGRRGRARSAIAYLAGFFLGLAATVGLVALAAASVITTEASFFNAGITAAFLGPFTGIVHAKLRRSARRRTKLVEA